MIEKVTAKGKQKQQQEQRVERNGEKRRKKPKVGQKFCREFFQISNTSARKRDVRMKRLLSAE